MTITDILGRQRDTDRDFPDGSYNCPFCWAAVMADYAAAANGMRCQNPACTAGIYATVAIAQTMLDKQIQVQREKDERERNHKLAMQRIEQDKQRRQDALTAMRDECTEHGYCFDCLRKRNKRVRHKAECPAQRPRIMSDLGLRKVKGAMGGTYYE